MSTFPEIISLQATGTGNLTITIPAIPNVSWELVGANAEISYSSASASVSTLDEIEINGVIWALDNSTVAVNTLGKAAPALGAPLLFPPNTAVAVLANLIVSGAGWNGTHVLTVQVRPR